jgi:hypothetical protein
VLGRRDEALAALGRAEEAFGRHQERSDTPGWVRFFSEADLAATAGFAHSELASHDARHAGPAVEALTVSLGRRQPDMTRSRAFELTMAATNHLRQGDLDHGASLGLEAVELARRLRSTRVVDRMAPLERELRPHLHRPDVQELHQGIAQLTA